MANSSTSLSGLLAVISDPSSTADLLPMRKLLGYAGYFVEGIIMSVGNLLILLPIAKHKALHLNKLFVLLAAMAFTDMINGVTYVIAGAHRVNAILGGNYKGMTTRWSCLVIPSNILWYFNETTTSVMMFVLSMDRLISVTAPMWHFKQGVTYARMMAGTAFLSGVCSGIVGIVQLYVHPRVKEVTELCTLSRAMVPFFNMYHAGVISYGAILSVLVYCAVVVQFRRRTRTVVEDTTKQSRALRLKKKMERKMTITMGISAFFTLTLLVIPVYIDQVSLHWFGVYCSPMCYLTANTNAIMNSVIFLVRHSELRYGLKAMLTGKQLGATVEQWGIYNKEKTSVTRTQSAWN